MIGLRSHTEKSIRSDNWFLNSMSEFPDRPSWWICNRKRQVFQPTHSIPMRPSHCPKPMRRSSREAAALAKRTTQALPAKLALEALFG
ncbi:hypothetical protein RBSH_06088 [Rhodopirellula baltica SH28]|uniref:Uncharacterized protein n=1 Tax=Rhodopirellula baltica SH28 TaxID=993517 RepID=K5C746_RHOBT|nr:hypothetical protein RBSH_06088 [Rhodopirellula baltica SH28]